MHDRFQDFCVGVSYSEEVKGRGCCFYREVESMSFLTLMLLVANFANTK